MHLRQAQLPRGTGVLDGGERASRGAAIVARHGDQVRIGFGDASGNGADPWLGDEFHRDLRVWVDLLEVKDQLRQVFDGVNIVVRRRRNQRDAGHRVAQAGNQLIDLAAWQLAAFTGLRALSHLDLQHFGIDQVSWRNTETT